MGHISVHLAYDNNVRASTDSSSGLVFVCRRPTGLFRFGIGSRQRYEENGWDWDRDFARLRDYVEQRHKRGMIIGWYTPEGNVFTYDHDRENIGKRLDVVRRCALAGVSDEPYLGVVGGRDERQAGFGS